jgi:hypothetical protein
MERMKHTGDYELDEINMLEQECADLENKRLEAENKKLKERIKELEECNLNLQEWLDNKEKVNKSLREENEKLNKFYDRDKEELMESCY